MGAKEVHIVLLQAENDGSAPTNLMQVLSRTADILQYASARDGIKILQQYNQMLETHSPEIASANRLDIRVFQPQNQCNYTVLDLSPANSKQLIEQGYEEAMQLMVCRLAPEQLPNIS
jgi:gamma-glutamyl phosphate reductase